jgi:phosphatidylinositol-3-phosphatase
VKIQPGIRVTASVAAVLLAGAVVAGCSSTTSTSSTSGTASGSTAAPAPGGTGKAGTVPTAGSSGPVGHVFIINLENESYEQTWGPASPATYLNKTLVPQGKLLTQYFGTGHNSLDNYISQISGQAPNPATQLDCPVYSDFTMTGTAELGQAIGSGCVYPGSVRTIADQLDAKGRTWKGYMEDMGNDPTAPATCRHPAIGEKDTTLIAHAGDQYATRHNPFVYFHSIIDSPVCAERDVALDKLDADLASAASTPNLSYITPNLCNDGHDAPCVNGEPGGLTSADTFLSTWVPKILASPAYRKDGMLIITFDEAEAAGADGDSSACCGELPGPNTDKPGLSGPGGGRVGALVLSPSAKPGTTNATPYNHYALLCSLENYFELDKLGMAGQPGLACFGADVLDKQS